MASRALLQRRAIAAVGALLMVAALPLARAEDGYELWLRYRPLEGAARERLVAHAAAIVVPPEPSARAEQMNVAEHKRGMYAALAAWPEPLRAAFALALADADTDADTDKHVSRAESWKIVALRRR